MSLRQVDPNMPRLTRPCGRWFAALRRVGRRWPGDGESGVHAAAVAGAPNGRDRRWAPRGHGRRVDLRPDQPRQQGNGDGATGDEGVGRADRDRRIGRAGVPQERSRCPDARGARGDGARLRYRGQPGGPAHNAGAASPIRDGAARERRGRQGHEGRVRGDGVGRRFWSTDVSYRKNPASVAKLKDLHMAPESATDLVPRNAHWSYSEGRELLGLEPITVGADGSVTRG